MSKMTVERATEFANRWNEGDAKKVAEYFTEDGAYYASVGPARLGVVFKGKKEIERGVQRFFDLFPAGKFENTVVHVMGDRGTFEWDFVTRDDKGRERRVAGCDILEFEGEMIKVKNAFRKTRE